MKSLLQNACQRVLLLLPLGSLAAGRSSSFSSYLFSIVIIYFLWLSGDSTVFLTYQVWNWGDQCCGKVCLRYKSSMKSPPYWPYIESVPKICQKAVPKKRSTFLTRWARAECIRRGEKESPTACREKLQGVQYLVRWDDHSLTLIMIFGCLPMIAKYLTLSMNFRYLTLTSEQFIGSPACPPSPLLTEEESDALHLAILVSSQQVGFGYILIHCYIVTLSHSYPLLYCYIVTFLSIVILLHCHIRILVTNWWNLVTFLNLGIWTNRRRIDSKNYFKHIIFSF